MDANLDDRRSRAQLRIPVAQQHAARSVLALEAEQTFEARTHSRAKNGFTSSLEFTSNTEIYRVDDPADAIYRVLSGGVRTCRVFDDGRRYIASFYLSGDFFGFENRLHHSFSCEAICTSTVQVVRRAFSRTAIPDKSNDVDLLTISADELRRAQFQSSLLVKTASERVGGFLLQMCAHSTRTNTFELPMTRQDIADHLGLTIETVSRVFTQLEAAHIILRTPRRHILVRNRSALEQMGG